MLVPCYLHSCTACVCDAVAAVSTNTREAVSARAGFHVSRCSRAGLKPRNAGSPEIWLSHSFLNGCGCCACLRPQA